MENLFYPELLLYISVNKKNKFLKHIFKIYINNAGMYYCMHMGVKSECVVLTLCRKICPNLQLRKKM